MNCVYRQILLEVFLSPRSDLKDRITPVFNALLPEGQKIWKSSIDFYSSFLRTEISRDFLSVLTMLCTTDDAFLKSFTILHYSELFHNL